MRIRQEDALRPVAPIFISLAVCEEWSNRAFGTKTVIKFGMETGFINSHKGGNYV